MLIDSNYFAGKESGQPISEQDESSYIDDLSVLIFLHSHQKLHLLCWHIDCTAHLPTIGLYIY